MIAIEDVEDPLYEPKDFAELETKIDDFLRDSFSNPYVNEANYQASDIRPGLANYVVGRYTRNGWQVSHNKGIVNTFFYFKRVRPKRPRRWYLLWIA